MKLPPPQPKMFLRFFSTVVADPDAKAVGRSLFYCCHHHPDLSLTCGVQSDITMPYSGSIPSTLVPGRIISIHGYIPVNANQFTVALSCGPTEDSDIAFNISVNVFACSYVARNSRVKGRWGKEESAMGQHNKFQRDMDVYIDIFTLEAAFYVAVNGRHFVKYRHRVSLSQIDTLRIDGDLHVDWIKHGVADVYPDVCPVNPDPYDVVVGPDALTGVEEEVRVPFIGKLAEKFGSGKQLVIEGRMELLPCMFYVRLQKGQNHWPPPNVALAITSRFMKTQTGNSELVLNSRNNAIWGSETVVPKYLFKPGTEFKLSITTVDDSYLIVVNDKLLAYFQHTLPPEEIADVDTVVIKGCVFVYKVYLN